MFSLKRAQRRADTLGRHALTSYVAVFTRFASVIAPIAQIFRAAAGPILVIAER